ncbi:ribonuclease R [Thermosynechococcaceae cyanobacterium BACA0444]|uniref:Ribonuclease R n=1 Tax=Pseudocalidococcus azoricus BACA0444 TaxID=2918990 RepID=A0AAE4JXY3_9CYAN|nr:ribonuclease R family protein [Pseudocalidococcus azoricus]MDS3860384.1 ribonuclease R [Pseudocalidococcus azoricus BACA0444]
MELSIASLLANFSDDKLVAPKALEKKLGCEDEYSLQRLQIALDALEKIGILVKERGKYRRVVETGVIEGRLRCSSKGFCFAIQEDGAGEDIFVREHQLSTAWNGDRVLVKVTREGRRKKSPEGEVKLILERNNPSVMARIRQTEAGLRGVPLDDRLLFEIELIPSEMAPDLNDLVDQLVHVEIIRYPLGGYLPLGQVVRLLGPDAQSANVVDLVCCKHDLTRPFPPALQAPSELLLARPDPELTRQDLRDLETIVIAAPRQELEVAFSLVPIGSQTWQLGVHFADIASQVPLNSPLDREAQRRGLAVSAVGLTIPLYPPQLEVLRLTPGVDRLAFSVILTLDVSGDVQAYEVQPTLIQVKHQITPEEAQTLSEKKANKGLSPILANLTQLTQALRTKRRARGSVDLTLSRQLPHLYPDEGVLGAMITEPGLARSEIMVLVNQLLGTHLQGLGLPAIYRVQLSPELYAIQDFLKLTRNLGLPLELTIPDGVNASDYQRFGTQLLSADLAPVLVESLLDTLKSPTNQLVPGPHFSLGLLNGYAQFSAPLQRYGDGFNQRVWYALFSQGRDRRSARTKETVNLRHSSCLGQVNWNVLPAETQRDLETHASEIMAQLQEREKTTFQALKDLQGLERVRQVQACIGEVRPGIITGVQSYGFFVELIEFSVEGLVHVSSLKDDWYEYRSQAQTLTGRRNRLRYRLGDRVEVQIKSVDSYRQQVDLVVISGGDQATEAELQTPSEPPEPLEENLEPDEFGEDDF